MRGGRCGGKGGRGGGKGGGRESPSDQGKSGVEQSVWDLQHRLIIC